MHRPKQMLAKGGRQAMWTRLRRGPATVAQLAKASGSQPNSIYAYMSGLGKEDYVEATGVGYVLRNDTGPRAPSINSTTGVLYDWNLNPPMAAAELDAIWAASGLSLTGFGAALGLGANAATHIRAMLDGARPISPAVEAKALAMQKPKKRRVARPPR